MINTILINYCFQKFANDIAEADRWKVNKRLNPFLKTRYTFKTFRRLGKDYSFNNCANFLDNSGWIYFRTATTILSGPVTFVFCERRDIGNGMDSSSN